jgi:AcrR family transcriptional regulator
MSVAPDAGERRASVIRQAAELIVEGGLPAVTVRNIAQRLGCSTTVVSHHFHDKDEVLLETYRYVNAQADALRNEALSAISPTPVRAIEELLPIGEAQRRHWTAWMHCWTAALNSPPLAVEHTLGLQRTFDRIHAYLLSLAMPDDRARAGAQTICNALYGIAVQAIFDRQRWSEGRQRAEFRRATAYALGHAESVTTDG